MSIATEQKVIEAIGTVNEPDNLIRLSTGVVLRGKQANPTALIGVLAHFPRPQPPVVYNKLMGRDMENPDDPDYKNRIRAWQVEQTDAVVNAFILLGTELSSKPKDMPGPSPKKGEKDWLKKYSLLGLPMLPEDEDWRYLAWIKNVACQNTEDTKIIQEVVGRLSGVSKSDVRAAEEFPGSQEVSG